MLKFIYERLHKLKILKKVLNVSLIKTVLFNFHYFGWEGLRFPVIVYRNYKLLKMSGEVQLGVNRTGIIQLGKPGVGICDDRYERGIWQVQGTIYFGGKSCIGAGTKIVCGVNGVLELGNEFVVTARSSIICVSKISFGNHVLISWDCLFMDTDFHSIYSADGILLNPDEEIKVGNHCWFCCNATLLKGSNIPNNTIIASGSRISKKFQEENTVVGDTKVLKSNVSWRGGFGSKIYIPSNYEWHI